MRINIRPLDSCDSQFMFQLLNSNDWIQFIGYRGIKTIEDAQSYINKILETQNLFYNVIEKLDSLEPIGILSFIQRDNFDSPDFGFALLPKFYNMGYAHEASVVYLKNVFEQQPALKVIAICQDKNVASIKLLNKLGFKYSHEVNNNGEQLNVFAITNQELIV